MAIRIQALEVIYNEKREHQRLKQTISQSKSHASLHRVESAKFKK
jgi:hypothetical protein